jgi:hypothetical protein
MSRYKLPPEAVIGPTDSARHHSPRGFPRLAARATSGTATVPAVAPTGGRDYYQYVYTDDQEELYADERNAGTAGRSFREWRTYQMSDHLPMWIELSIDDGMTYLESQRKPTNHAPPGP